MLNCINVHNIYGRSCMSFNNNNKQFLINQLMWLGVSLGISIAISMLLPFPISLVTIIGVFVMLNLYMRKRMLQRMGMGRGGSLFGSMSSSGSVDSTLKYYCMRCGKEHKEIACPECGSKMKKVGY
jgi:hypothetical protein